MACMPVADWKTDLEVSTFIQALRECYPLTADDSYMSTYDKWAALNKSMQKTITVDQANIDQLRKSYSERLISAMANYGDMPADREVCEGLQSPLKSQQGVRRGDAFSAWTAHGHASGHEHLGEGALQAVAVRAG